jgi:hypothetical protein
MDHEDMQLARSEVQTGWIQDETGSKMRKESVKMPAICAVCQAPLPRSLPEMWSAHNRAPQTGQYSLSMCGVQEARSRRAVICAGSSTLFIRTSQWEGGPFGCTGPANAACLDS